MGRLRYFDIVYILTSCFAGYQIIQSLTGESNPIFSVPITLGWQIVSLVFWAFWLLGSIGMVMKKKFSFVLLFPVSLLSLIALLFSFPHIIYDTINAQFLFASELILVMLILVDINLKRTKSMLGIASYGRFYLIGGVFFVFQALLFLLIDKH